MLEGFTAQAALALQSSSKTAELVELRKLAFHTAQASNSKSVNLFLDSKGRISFVTSNFSEYFGDVTAAQGKLYEEWFDGTNEELEIRIKRSYRFKSSFSAADFLFKTRSGDQIICSLFCQIFLDINLDIESCFITFE